MDDRREEGVVVSAQTRRITGEKGLGSTSSLHD